jgi:hypothetical protein
MPSEPFKSFAEFCPFYLAEHRNRTSRRLHFIDISIAAVLLVVAALTRRPGLLALALVPGYAFAWVGHFFFEHNKPATFKYPRLSFMGDWWMWWQILTGKIPF